MKGVKAEPAAQVPDGDGCEGATYNRLLDTAERLFAQRGFGAVSVRAVTIEAGSNIAAVHYHFGSKIALLRAIYLRRSASLNAERDLLLTEHMLESNGKPTVAGIIRAFVEPAFRTSPCFAQLSAKIAVDTSPEVRAVATETLGALLPKFIGALIAARPDLRRDEIAWRFLCVIGALMYARVETGFIRRVTGEGVENPDRQGIGILDPEAACEAIVPFLTAGFDAPASCGAQAAPVARFDITPGPRPATRARSRSAGRGRR